MRSSKLWREAQVCSSHRTIPFLSLKQGRVAQGTPMLDAHLLRAWPQNLAES